MWRIIDKGEKELLLTAHRFENSFPQFYRDASHSWTATEDEVLKFFAACSHLYGAFDKEGLAALIYFRPITATHQEVHMDARRGVDKEFLLNAICEVRDDRLNADTVSIETWVLKRNRALQQMLTKARLGHTGLEMRAGEAHGKVLRWVQMLVTR